MIIHNETTKAQEEESVCIYLVGSQCGIETPAVCLQSPGFYVPTMQSLSEDSL